MKDNGDTAALPPSLEQGKGDANTDDELLLQWRWRIPNKLLSQLLQFVNLVSQSTEHLCGVLNTAHEYISF